MKGTCKHCYRENMSLPAKGLCGRCYDELHPQKTRKTKRKRTENPVQLLPVKKLIPIWECTDGTEFGNEVDALRHQIEINAHGMRKG